MNKQVDEIFENWNFITKEHADVEIKHHKYINTLRELKKEQDECLKLTKSISKKIKEVNILKKNLKSSDLSKLSEVDSEKMTEVNEKLPEITSKLRIMENELPAEGNGWYLNLILGSNLKLKLLTGDERYDYKRQYEEFKINLSYIVIVMVIIALIFPFRAIDALLNFLLVWYYCTLTIREAILRVNGSHIKGWWLLHHYVSCVLCGVTLTWENSECYRDTRIYLLVLVLYVASVQIMQYSYQSGCLRRLHALGQRHCMDITVEGFVSWMFKGLQFLIPFLLVGYILQLLISYELFSLYNQDRCNGEWQIIASSFVFFTISIGNILTLAKVVYKKMKEPTNESKILKAKSKYRSKPLFHSE
uniref:Transmembrane protein 120 homolog n=1 Tax=Parastrongyloides trichosuri TaxID=131310 RepID=A0A0N4ZUM9_PARTI